MASDRRLKRWRKLRAPVRWHTSPTHWLSQPGLQVKHITVINEQSKVTSWPLCKHPFKSFNILETFKSWIWKLSSKNHFGSGPCWSHAHIRNILWVQLVRASFILMQSPYSSSGTMKAIKGVRVAPSKLTKSEKKGTICAMNQEAATIRSTC